MEIRRYFCRDFNMSLGSVKIGRNREIYFTLDQTRCLENAANSPTSKAFVLRFDYEWFFAGDWESVRECFLLWVSIQLNDLLMVDTFHRSDTYWRMRKQMKCSPIIDIFCVYIITAYYDEKNQRSSKTIILSTIRNNEIRTISFRNQSPENFCWSNY